MRRMSFKLLIPTGLLAALLVWDPVAKAVGLGAVDVESSLNQPLRAEIPLLSVSGLDMNEVEVGLASPEDFQRVGIERSVVLERLNFTVDQSGSQPIIRVSSEEAVAEPFLSFLVRVSWPQGRLLREYTILLDPPVTAPAAAPEPEQAPSSTVDRDEPGADDRDAEASAGPATSGQPAATQPAGQPAADRTGGGRYGPVSSGETLWSIANRTRPDSSISVNQMMMALLRTNPEAFYQDNINALRRGAVLRVPDGSEVRELTASEALGAVRRQNELWQDYRRNLAREAPTVVEGGETREPAAQQPAADSGSRLELVPPREGEGEAETARAGSAGDGQSGSAGREELRQELTRAREELLARQQQNDQLDGRVSELEAQVDRLQRLLELKNDELAAMQAQGTEGDGVGDQETEASPAGVEDAPAGEDLTAAGEDAATGETGDAMPAAGQARDDAAGADAQTGADTAAQPEPREQPGEAGQPGEEAAATRPEPPPTPAERGWMQMLLSPLVLGIAGLLLIGIGVALFLHRRGGAGSEPTLQRESLGSRMARSRDDEAGESKPEAADEGAEEDFGPPEAGPADYDKAALVAALEEDPSDTETRLKLIRHYAATIQRDAFIEQAETLYAELADPAAPAWLETRALGEEVAPDHALFGGSGEDIRSEAGGPEDSGAAGDEAPAPPSYPPAPHADPSRTGAGGAEAASGDTSDTDLPDLDFGGTDETPAGEETPEEPSRDETPEAAGESGTGSGEFDLSDLQDDTRETPPADAPADDTTQESGASAGDEFDLGDKAEPRESEDQEPLEFDLSDFESDADDEAGTGQGADDTDDWMTGGDTDADADESATDSAPSAGTGDTAPAGDEPPAEQPPAGEEAPAAGGGGEAVDTKLELAEAYLDMGDQDGAREMLEEVLGEGDEGQQKRAREMLDRLN